mgnify:CR=1 FL=1
MNLRQLIQPDADWLDAPTPRRVAWVALTACAGLAIYGFTVGFWRDPVMGAYVAVKMIWEGGWEIEHALLYTG